MIYKILFTEGNFRITAIDGRRTGIDKMLHPWQTIIITVAASLQNVIKADDV